MTTEIKFHEITLDDKSWMDEKFLEDGRSACEYSFANNFIWRKSYQVEVAEIYGCAVIRFQNEGKCVYSYPIGAGDKRKVIEALQVICKERGCSLKLSPLCEADRMQLLEWFPGQFFVQGNRDDYDYIYSREKLAKLSGKKLHGKRNHIARFKDGDNWSYEAMTENNLEDCRSMTYTWMRMRSEKWNEEMEQEVRALHEAFDHMRELNLTGGVLRKEGEIVAFCIGEQLNQETFVVHFEKAFPDMQGAYPMINQQFVLNVCEKYDYVNREEDAGDLGLRKAKLSYYPEIILKKYIALESRVVLADKQKDREQILKIWQTCFKDEEDYVNFYLEHRMTEENMLVIYQDGKIVSMASFLPAEYLKDQVYTPVRYVYAVATLPEYRGQGLAREILEFAQRVFDEPLILSPAGESLIGYYEKLGFLRAFAGSNQVIQAGIHAMELAEKESVLLEEVTAEEYTEIRDVKLAGEGYVRWDTEAVRYAMEVVSRCGGGVCTIVSGEVPAEQEMEAECGKDILMYETEGETLVVLETTLSEEKMSAVLPTLLQKTGMKEFVFRRPMGMIWMPESMGGEQIFKDGYLNLTLG